MTETISRDEAIDRMKAGLPCETYCDDYPWRPTSWSDFDWSGLRFRKPPEPRREAREWPKVIGVRYIDVDGHEQFYNLEPYDIHVREVLPGDVTLERMTDHAMRVWASNLLDCDTYSRMADDCIKFARAALRSSHVTGDAVSEPTMEQMLDAYRVGVMPRAANRRQRVREIRDTILARFAELERERDEARVAAEKEFESVMALSAERDAYRADAERIRAVVAEWQAHFLSSYREDRTTYREGKSDAADFILARVDAAIAQRAGETG